MSVLWSENGRDWERKPVYAVKPGMFRSWKMLALATGCILAAGVLLAYLLGLGR